ncbi:MAG TPA: helix-turn-helix transcriptional regulator [Actinoplanes sp.]|nr:helix-turn-helix transcriptional regulator [Actinoplanes sp.]
MTGDAPADPYGLPAPSLGEALRHLRRNARVTGQQLAQRVGMSQARISRLENEVIRPTPHDVETLARALNAPDEVIARLVRRAAEAENRMTDWRSSTGAVADLQREVEELESVTQIFRVFQPTVIPGLLQTSEYARAVLSANHQVRTGVLEEAGAVNVLEAVSARMHRQIALSDRRKHFFFLIAEAVLSNRFGQPDHMPGQIERLREVADHENVRLAIIPADAPLYIPPMHGFILLDERRVTVDIYNTMLRSDGAADVEIYKRTFDILARSATEDIDDILDRHYDYFLKLSGSRRRRAAKAP